MKDHWSIPECDRLRRMLPHDLGERPVYILSDLDYLDDRKESGLFFPGRSCIAYTGPALDLRLESRLRDLDLWEGRGFAMIINDHTLWRFCLSDSEQFGTVLHESFHHLVSYSTAIWQIAEKPEHREHVRASRPGESIGLSRESPAIRPPWFMHGSAFIRAGLHGIQRSPEGYDPDDIGLAGDIYGLSHAKEYAKALGNELTDRSNEAISEILKSDPPAAFLELWERDTAGWQPTTETKDCP